MSHPDEEPQSPDDYLRDLQSSASAPQPGTPWTAYPGPHPAMPPPSHPSATTSMVLGIVGLASIPVMCGLGLFLSPVAWVMGSRAVSEIDRAPGRYTGREQANAGRITGIIGTILLAVGLVALALAIVALVVAAPETTSPAPTYSEDSSF